MVHSTAGRFIGTTAATLFGVTAVLAMVSCSSDDYATNRTPQRPMASQADNVYTNDDMSSRRQRKAWRREAELPPRTAAANAQPAPAGQQAVVTTPPAPQPASAQATTRGLAQPMVVDSPAVTEVAPVEPTPRPQPRVIVKAPTTATPVATVEPVSTPESVAKAPAPAEQPSEAAAVEVKTVEPVQVMEAHDQPQPVQESAPARVASVEIVEAVEPSEGDLYSDEMMEHDAPDLAVSPEHASLALSSIQPPELLPADVLYDKPSVNGLDRSSWSTMVVKPTEGTVYHTRTYHDDVRFERKHSPVAHAQGAQDDVEVMLIAATDRPHTHTLSKRNAKALVRQPIEFGLDMIKAPFRMINNPPSRTETSPRTIDPTALDYRLSDVPADSPDCGHHAHEHQASNQPASSVAPLKVRMRNAGS